MAIDTEGSASASAVGGGAAVELSVVVPAFQCADSLADDVASLERVLRDSVPSYEVIVVVDGDVDGTCAAAAGIASEHVSVLHYEPNRGKGFAVVTGMLHARGGLVGFMDAGGDIAPGDWETMLAVQRERDADIVVGSKWHPDSRLSYPWARRLYSRGYHLLTRLLFRLDIRDTQTGIKLFRSEIVRDVVPCLLVKRFAFDVELLALAHRRGYRRIFEAPVNIRHNFRSTIDLGAVFRVFWDTAAVFYRLNILRYYDRIDPALERERRLADVAARRLA